MPLKVEQRKSWFRKHSDNSATSKDLQGVDYNNDQDRGQPLLHGSRMPEYRRQRLPSLLLLGNLLRSFAGR